MKRLDAILVALVASILGGCASSYPHPVVVDGNYYMLGGSDCIKYKRSADPVDRLAKVVDCYTSDEEFTGKRFAMSDEELQSYIRKQNEKVATLEGVNSEVGAPARPESKSDSCKRGIGC